MKYIILLLLLFCKIFSYSQQNLFPDIFPKTKGIKEIQVYRDCPESKKKEKNKHWYTIYFNDNGYNISKGFIEKGKEVTRQKYFYNQDGSLDYYENYNFQTNYTSPNRDVLVISNEVKYEYKQGMLTKLKWLDGYEKILNLQVNYLYDSLQFLIKEEVLEYETRGFKEEFIPNTNYYMRLNNIVDTTIKLNYLLITRIQFLFAIIRKIVYVAQEKE